MMMIRSVFTNITIYFQRFTHFFGQKHRTKTKWALGLMVLWFCFCLPRPLFDVPISPVVEDSDGNLLGARIASDGQWRFPPIEQVPEKFERCILEFEDRYFYQHLGINPLAIGRALKQNIRNQEVISGGSTITMQVIRLARGVKNRNIFSKMAEAVMSVRLSLTASKRRVLQLYASNAPFGGNVVGLEAASWRYYNKKPKDLSWGEAATLAVLPNAPAMIHVSKNRDALLAKRNRLIDRLIEKKELDPNEGELAKEEPLPAEPLPLPQLAPHLLERVFAEKTAGYWGGGKTKQKRRLTQLCRHKSIKYCRYIIKSWQVKAFITWRQSSLILKRMKLSPIPET